MVESIQVRLSGEAVAKALHLSEEELNEMLPSGRSPVFTNRIAGLWSI